MSDMIPLRTIHPDMPFAAAAREVLGAQVATAHIWAAFLPQPDCVREHHQLRIAIKQLRYSLEVFAEVVPDAAAGCLDDLKALQAALGKLHDTDMLLASIGGALARLDEVKRTRRYEAARTRVAVRRGSLEALASAIAVERETQHQVCLTLWQAFADRAGLAPIERAIALLATLPESVAPPLTSEEESTYD